MRQNSYKKAIMLHFFQLKRWILLFWQVLGILIFYLFFSNLKLIFYIQAFQPYFKNLWDFSWLVLKNLLAHWGIFKQQNVMINILLYLVFIVYQVKIYFTNFTFVISFQIPDDWLLLFFITIIDTQNYKSFSFFRRVT